MSRSGLRANLRARRNEFELDASLHVEAGETLALVGPNGAGKSTIVALLAGLVPLDPDLGGSIELDGTVLDDSATGRFVPSPDRHVGVVFQDHLLFGHLSVRDNIAFGLRSRGVGRRASRTAAESLLVRCGLGTLGGRRPAQLSGGQAQRVALARALASEPALLLLDEPLSALDVETRRDVRRLLADQLESFPGPAVIITHDPVDAMLLADRVAVVEAGRLTQVGTLDEIRRHPASRYIATLVGTNLLDGIADGSSVDITTEAGHHRLTVADSSFVGPVRLTIRPEAVSLHPEPPSGSQRNVWETAVAVVEPLGDTTRITLAAPIHLAIDVTSAAAESLGLAPGTPIWAAVKATEIAVTPA